VFPSASWWVFTEAVQVKGWREVNLALLFRLTSRGKPTCSADTYQN